MVGIGDRLQKKSGQTFDTSQELGKALFGGYLSLCGGGGVFSVGLFCGFFFLFPFLIFISRRAPL